ncbi:MAG: sigma-70 family RNA polymerase sigma factor [Myxococcus sp.]|nr:sigma-70 family RNA polymerase sigma factor [Myxococcus sp.]
MAHPLGSVPAAVEASSSSAPASSRAKPVWLPWVAGARRSERDAFGKLHQHFARLVHAVIITRVPASDAADLTQDVFVQMLSKLPGLQDDQAFPAWLLEIARNRAARFLRDRPRTAPLEDVDEAEAPDRSGWPDAKKVLLALQTMPEAYAETLAMRLIEGLSGPDIAERTGLTSGSVRVNLHRGMAMLREKLGLSPKEGDE